MKKSEVLDEIMEVIRKEQIRIDGIEHPLKDKELSVGYDGEPIIFDEEVDDGFSNEYVSKEDMFHIGCMEGQWVCLGLIDKIKKIINQHY